MAILNILLKNSNLDKDSTNQEVKKLKTSQLHHDQKN